jgi:hypothetical protein
MQRHLAELHDLVMFTNSKRVRIFPAARAALSIPVAAAAVAVGLLAMPAAAANAESANVTIGLLEAQGFDVKVNRIGSAPLDECVVTDVFNPREQKRFERFGDERVEVVFRRTITVSLDCSRR